MTMLGDCIPCRYGHHSEHQDVPGPVPEGVIGGWVCPCTGDCAERNAESIKRSAPKPHPPNCCCAACKAVRGLHVEGYTTTDDDDESGHW